jgi:hypothetical protein
MKPSPFSPRVVVLLACAGMGAGVPLVTPASAAPARSVETRPTQSTQSTHLTLERLKTRYAGLSRLQADVEQTRTGRHLLKPFVSEIKLDYTPGAITWTYMKPFRKTVKVTREGFDLGDRRLPAAHGERLKSLTAMLDALFRMDLERLNADFELKIEGDAVAARPRGGSPLKFVKAMDFEFDKDLDILSVTVATDSDTAVMKFSNIRVDK